MICSADTISTEQVQALSSPRAGGVLDALKTAWSAFWERRAQRATVLMLNSLDDHALRDLGLGRSEISSLVYGGGRRQRYKPKWE